MKRKVRRQMGSTQAAPRPRLTQSQVTLSSPQQNCWRPSDVAEVTSSRRMRS